MKANVREGDSPIRYYFPVPELWTSVSAVDNYLVYGDLL